MPTTEEINKYLLKELDSFASGLEWIDFYNLIKNKYPDIEEKDIHNEIKIFIDNNLSNIYKEDGDDKSKYKLHKNHSVIFVPPAPEDYYLRSKDKNIKEAIFYDSFATWLEKDQEECTKVKVLGGKAFGDKWGTPDVIGVLKSKPTDTIKQEIEIISAEIKIVIDELITGFGQACSYKLFSHKVYLVIPRQSDPDELARIDSLCYLFGIGLVLFDYSDPATPNYHIKHRSQKSSPDISYINKYINKKKDLFNDLLS